MYKCKVSAVVAGCHSAV